MIAYLLLFLIPMVFSALSIGKNRKGYTLRIGTGERNNLAIPAFFVFFLLLLALRDETIGRDLNAYKQYFYKYSAYSFSELFYTWKESLFRLTNWLIGKCTTDYQVYLAVVSVIVVVPIAYVYIQNRYHGYLKTIVFINMSTFVMLFSGLRQSLAMAIGMIAYVFVKKKKPLVFILFATVALFMHHSGFMVFLMYPIYHMRFKKKHLFLIVPVFLGTLILNKQIFGFLTGFLSDYSDKYGVVITTTGAYGSLILFMLFLLFSCFISDESKMDNEAFGLRNLMAFSVLLQCFAPLSFVAMRLNYYFILLIPLTLGKMLDTPKAERKEIARLGEIVLCVFFTIYFVSNTYISYKTGISALDTIPYIPFWK